jgi:hypothetical protein
MGKQYNSRLIFPANSKLNLSILYINQDIKKFNYISTLTSVRARIKMILQINLFVEGIWKS